MTEGEIYHNKHNMKTTMQPKLEFHYIQLNDRAEDIFERTLFSKTFALKKLLRTQFLFENLYDAIRQ